MEDQSGQRLRLPLATLLLAIALGGTVDLVLDRPRQWLSFHVIYELALVVAALGMAAWLWHGWRDAERENAVLRQRLATHRAEQEAWLASAEHSLAGLRSAIDAQFERWGLTPAEREVGMLLLQGKSHKEIAAASSRSERTVRQHATVAYQKAGLGGRAELAAFFLEGLGTPAAVSREP